MNGCSQFLQNRIYFGFLFCSKKFEKFIFWQNVFTLAVTRVSLNRSFFSLRKWLTTITLNMILTKKQTEIRTRSNNKTSEGKLYPDWWLIWPYQQHKTEGCVLMKVKKTLVYIFMWRNKAQKWSHRKFTKLVPQKLPKEVVFYQKERKNKTTPFFF